MGIGPIWRINSLTPLSSLSAEEPFQTTLHRRHQSNDTERGSTGSRLVGFRAESYVFQRISHC